jgi:hypothetical protein
VSGPRVASVVTSMCPAARCGAKAEAVTGAAAAEAGRQRGAAQRSHGRAGGCGRW